MISDRWRNTEGSLPLAYGEDVIYHHNSNFTGEVLLNLPDICITKGPPASFGDLTQVAVPMALIKSIVATWLRGELVDRLENAGDDAVLLGGWDRS